LFFEQLKYRRCPEWSENGSSERRVSGGLIWIKLSRGRRTLAESRECSDRVGKLMAALTPSRAAKCGDRQSQVRLRRRIAGPFHTWFRLAVSESVLIFVYDAMGAELWSFVCEVLRQEQVSEVLA
jgi:hypothetical protein